MTAHILPWLRTMAQVPRSGSPIPAARICPRPPDRHRHYCVPTALELEDRTERQVTLYRLSG